MTNKSINRLAQLVDKTYGIDGGENLDDVLHPKKRRLAKRYSVTVQTDYREEDSQHVYSDCLHHFIPEPDIFIDGVGLEYPEIPEKEMESDSVSVEEAGDRVAEIPAHMTRVPSSYSKQRNGLAYPHRNRALWKKLKKPILAEQFVILEPFQTLSYQGLEYLESCLSFESILDKLETGGGDPLANRSRAVALRLLLRLPSQSPDEFDAAPTTTGRIHSRIHLSAKGKHHRVLTPRVDTTIIQQLGRKSAVMLLQKFLRGRARMLAMEKTKARWEESYDELNGFDLPFPAVGMNPGIDLETNMTDKALVRALVGQLVSLLLQPLLRNSMAPSQPTVAPKGRSLQSYR